MILLQEAMTGSHGGQAGPEFHILLRRPRNLGLHHHTTRQPALLHENFTPSHLREVVWSLPCMNGYPRDGETSSKLARSTGAEAGWGHGPLVESLPSVRAQSPGPDLRPCRNHRVGTHLGCQHPRGGGSGPETKSHPWFHSGRP